MYTLGIDIGSTSSKAVILRDGSELLANQVISLGTGTIGPEQALDAALREAGIARSDIAFTVVTGYGRMNYASADAQVSELSCHAKGIHFLMPKVRTIIDIGGQDAKALQLSETGQLLAFQMNDKCAAGTGRFLEVMAKVLNVGIGDLGALSAQADKPAVISNTCTVFAESEVISQLSASVSAANIAAGIHNSVAKRVAGMALRLGHPSALAMSGGVALNAGVVRAMARELGCPIQVHPLCQSAGAIGAALFAWEKHTKKEGSSHE